MDAYSACVVEGAKHGRCFRLVDGRKIEIGWDKEGKAVECVAMWYKGFLLMCSWKRGGI